MLNNSEFVCDPERDETDESSTQVHGQRAACTGDIARAREWRCGGRSPISAAASSPQPDSGQRNRPWASGLGTLLRLVRRRGYPKKMGWGFEWRPPAQWPIATALAVCRASDLFTQQERGPVESTWPLPRTRTGDREEREECCWFQPLREQC